MILAIILQACFEIFLMHWFFWRIFICIIGLKTYQYLYVCDINKLLMTFSEKIEAVKTAMCMPTGKGSWRR